MTPINLEQFNKLHSFIETSKLKQLIEDFFEPNSSGKNDLVSYLKSQDLENISKKAHYIKGSASFLGMEQIMNHCIFIEKEMKENPTPNFSQLIADFHNIWDTSYSEAQSLVSGS